ncbi:SRPBCC domain-containing protein [Flammeovirga sp. SubArs3]|uniref:SRPBCC family protein n=1 Tax=Flammeovirga sp. SubArs3 TaxID=2995316 RepID=UPI00248CC251|nr:SRPBCC domain-containing protein [Flammeovirga sp. SubArs3]
MKIIVEENIPLGQVKLWEVITHIDHLHQWFFKEIPSFQLDIGFTTVFDVQSNTRTFPHRWEVIDINRDTSYTLKWEYDGYIGTSTLQFSIKAVSNQESIITVIADGIDSFPQDIEEFKPENCKAGWNYFIKERLKPYTNTLK